MLASAQTSKHQLSSRDSLPHALSEPLVVTAVPAAGRLHRVPHVLFRAVPAGWGILAKARPPPAIDGVSYKLRKLTLHVVWCLLRHCDETKHTLFCQRVNNQEGQSHVDQMPHIVAGLTEAENAQMWVWGVLRIPPLLTEWGKALNLKRHCWR